MSNGSKAPAARAQMTLTTKNFFIRLTASVLTVYFAALFTSSCAVSSQNEPETLRIGVAVYLQEDTFIAPFAGSGTLGSRA